MILIIKRATSSGGFTTLNVSSNITLVANTVHLVDTSAARSLALPAPVKDLTFVIKDSTGQASTNNITVTRFAAESIEGLAASKVFATDWGSWQFVSDGTNWFLQMI